MKGYNRCTNGHYYKEQLVECPYCPKQGDAKPVLDLERTQIQPIKKAPPVAQNNTEAPAEQKTVIDNQISGIGNRENTIKETPNNQSSVLQKNTNPETQKKEVAAVRELRKITGWLISYTHDELGVDYHIYEGRNTVGRTPENTISLPFDPNVSAHHSTIHYRNGKFKIKDELSTSGTFVGDEDLEPGEIYALQDGSTIRIGATVFLFRSAVQPSTPDASL